LQLLEDRGWVSVEVVEGKKIYTISDSGRQALSEYNERANAPFGGPGAGFGPGFGPFGDPGFGQRGHHGHHGERPERPEPPERPERPERGRRGWGDERRGPWGPFGWETGPELRALAHESRDVARLVR